MVELVWCKLSALARLPCMYVSATFWVTVVGTLVAVASLVGSLVALAIAKSTLTLAKQVAEHEQADTDRKVLLAVMMIRRSRSHLRERRLWAGTCSPCIRADGRVAPHRQTRPFLIGVVRRVTLRAKHVQDLPWLLAVWE